MTREEVNSELDSLELEVQLFRAKQHERRQELWAKLSEIKKQEKADLYKRINKCFYDARSGCYYKIAEVVNDRTFSAVTASNNKVIKRVNCFVEDIFKYTPIELEEFNLAYSRCLIEINK